MSKVYPCKYHDIYLWSSLTLPYISNYQWATLFYNCRYFNLNTNNTNKREGSIICIKYTNICLASGVYAGIFLGGAYGVYFGSKFSPPNTSFSSHFFIHELCYILFSSIMMFIFCCSIGTSFNTSSRQSFGQRHWKANLDRSWRDGYLVSNVCRLCEERGGEERVRKRGWY